MAAIKWRYRSTTVYTVFHGTMNKATLSDFYVITFVEQFSFDL